MNRFRVLLGFVLGVSLSLAAIPGADGAAVPGERILYVDIPASFDVHVMDQDGSNDSVLIERGGSPAVSPDGQWVAYSNGKLMVAPVNGGGDPVIVFESGEDQTYSSFSWSPDSRRLIFYVRTTKNEDVEHEPSYFDVWMVNRDGSGLVNLTNTPVAVEFFPLWFPDGQRILFTSMPAPWAAPDERGLAVMDVGAANGYEVIAQEPGLHFSTTYAGFVNDSRQVIMPARPVLNPDPENPQYGPRDLWRVDIASGHSSLLLGGNTDNNMAVMDVSTDGSMMLYASYSTTASTLWLADDNGGNRTKLYKEAGFAVGTALFNSDDTLVLLNTINGDTDYIVVKDLATRVAKTVLSGESLDSPQWVAPGVLCDGVVATITGTDGDDTLIGTSGDDVIVGYGGDDVIEGRGGDDVICAGYGNDTVRGEAGNDTLLGGPGQDELRGGAGKDTVRGESGNDTLYGGKGKDVIRGGDGADWIHGQWRPDRLYGNLGQDVIYGGDDDDLLDGGKANDKLYGGAGDDTVAGNKGDDHLSGGPGDDTLDGGPDIDVVNGNAGTDTCTGETTLNC